MTDFAHGIVPAFYREVFDICSPNGDPLSKNVFKELLKQSKLSTSILKEIWEICGGSSGHISRINLYKSLVYIASAQKGKQLSEKLLDTFVGKEFPIPDLGDLSVIKNLHCPNVSTNKSVINYTYSDLVKIDSITIDLVPEKKGIFLKHSEYLVSSIKHNSTVKRRYNDFVAFHEMLLMKFPYRLIPRLPPKKIVFDSHFLESRRKALQRWLTLIARHPILSSNPLIEFFLTDGGPELQHRIKELFKRQPDEFLTSDLSEKAKDLLPPDMSVEFPATREQLTNIWNGVHKMQLICERGAERSRALAQDTLELSTQLKELATESYGHSQWTTNSNTVWNNIKRGLGIISKEFTTLSNSALRTAEREENTVCEQLGLLNDAFAAHSALCERIERGVLHDHQRALQHMLSLKKRQIQGVIKGTDAERIDQLETKMMQQESVISNMELRNAFSLYCVHIETQLLHIYLEIFASVLSTMVSIQIQAHSELADVWKSIQPGVIKCLSNKFPESVDKCLKNVNKN